MNEKLVLGKWCGYCGDDMRKKRKKVWHGKNKCFCSVTCRDSAIVNTQSYIATKSSDGKRSEL